jgi:hypothetical protein
MQKKKTAKSKDQVKHSPTSAKTHRVPKVKLPKPDPEHPMLVDKLKPDYQKLVYGRLEHDDLIDLAKVSELAYGTIKHLFEMGRPVRLAYDELVLDRTKALRRQYKHANKKLQEAVPIALETMTHAAAYKWQAAESVLHMAGYNPSTKIKVETEKNTVDKLADVLKGFEDEARAEMAGENQETG